MANRDEQFSVYSAALWQKIAARIEALDDECNKTEEVVDGCVMCNLKPERIAKTVEPIIRRAAYDLVAHTLHQTCRLTANLSEPMDIVCEDQFIGRIPDMPMLPEDKTK